MLRPAQILVAAFASLLFAAPAFAQNTLFPANPGDMIVRGTGTTWVGVPGGTAGCMLRSQGPTAAPTWSCSLPLNFQLPPMNVNTLWCNINTAQAPATQCTISQILSTIDYDIQRPPLAGSIPYVGANSIWHLSPPPAAVGWVWTAQGTGQAPQWVPPSGYVQPGAAGTCLVSNGPTVAPSFATCPTSGSFPVDSVFSRTGSVTAQSGDYSVGQVTGAAPIASPTLTGVPAAPTATPGTNTTQLATTEFTTGAVATAVTGLAPLASPALTGNPTAPTATTTDSDTSIATTAFVQANVVVCDAGIEGLSANNSQLGFADTANIMLITAKCLTLYNPSTGMRRGYKYGTVTAALTADLRNAGPVAGGRDQAAAFVARDNVFLYHIAGTAGLNVIISKTCPSCTNGGGTIGPVLPANYDTYRYDFPAILSDAGTFIYDSRHNDEGTRCSLNGWILAFTLTVTSVSANCTATAAHNIANGNCLPVGTCILRGGVALDTRITARGTGTGTTGTYTVSKSQTVGSAGTPVAMVSTDESSLALLVSGNRAYFNGSILVNLTGVVTFGSVFNWDYSIYIPTLNAATDLTVQLDFEVAATGAATTSGLFVYNQSTSAPCVGSNTAVGVYSTYAYGAGLVFAYNPIQRVPVFCTNLMPMEGANAGGAAGTPTVVNFIWDYGF